MSDHVSAPYVIAGNASKNRRKTQRKEYQMGCDRDWRNKKKRRRIYHPAEWPPAIPF